MAFSSIFAPFIISTSMPMLSILFMGITLASLGGLLGLLIPGMFKGFLRCMKWFVNLHSMWVCNKKVFNEAKA
jgi:hypothetical protein